MKIIKNIIGVILILFGTITIVQMSGQESGAGLFGAFAGYLILLAISIWLLYSANKKEKLSKFVQQKTEITNNNFDKIEALRNLKEQDILNENEFNDKISKLENAEIQLNIEKTTEFKQLKGLLNSSVLTKEEFESKYQILLKKYKELSEFGYTITSNTYKNNKTTIKNNSKKQTKMITNADIPALIFLIIVLIGILMGVLEELFVK